MFENYLKTAIRNLLRNKLFSAINIVGLAIGLAAFILILLFVRDEKSWDKHWKDAESLYRIETSMTFATREDRRTDRTPNLAKNMLLNTYSEIEGITRYIDANVTLRAGDELLSQYTLIAESNFTEIFDLEFIEGNAATALADPSGVVISERTAARIFGPVNEKMFLGRTIEMSFGGDLRDVFVAGVIADPQVDSTINHDFILPFQREYFEGSRWFTDNWGFSYWITYARLAAGADVDLVRADLPALLDRTVPYDQDGAETGSEWKIDLHLVPLSDVHLLRAYGDEDPVMLYGLITVAFLILIIAVVNFLNLSMARTVYRAREVAMRKVLGAGRGQIVQQFLGESILLAFISLLIALVMIEVALPYYREFLSSMVDLELIGQPLVFGAIILLGVVVGLSAGSLQSLYFSFLKPRDVLYSSTAPDNRTSKLRMGLVVAQFAISVALMVIAFFVNKQVEYARTLDLGFNADNLVVVSGTSGPNSDDFKHRLLESPYVKAVGRSSDVPTEGSEDRIQMRPVSGGAETTLDGLPIDPDFFKAYEINLIAGRYLTTSEADIVRPRSDEGTYREAGNIVINASGAKLLGFETPEAAIGQIFPTTLRPEVNVSATIVGVVDDFHFDSARSVIRPGIYYVDHLRQADMSVRIDEQNRALALAHIQEAWSAVFPTGVLRYRVMKDMVERQYQADDKLGGVLAAFTVLAIVVSCLGLYGLASFTVERRTKEIGIRKVLGAGLNDIVTLLLWQFSKPILIANLVAWPVAFYFLSDWLNTFVYRIELGLLPFAVLGGSALAIGWLTVAGRAIIVARTNPINALRCE
ncbi:MAG: ABC transporter permease [Kordiimonas sp.]